MKLIELINKKDMLNTKIDELKTILSIKQSDALADELYSLLQEKQGLFVNLHKINTISKITIGSTEIDVATAIIIKNIMMEKMNIITSLIENISCELDKLELQKQRDIIYYEYSVLSNTILHSDMNITIDYKG